jgi:hypothetical protein
MLKQLEFQVPTELINIAIDNLPSFDFRVSLNKPLGRFFYDPWEIKQEFKDTVWEQILATLPFPYGEARIITLESGTNYRTHADIDDRYHLNLHGEDCFLINLEEGKMFPLRSDGIWYDMNAGLLHTAANFGRISRMQLVVRKLLVNGNINDSANIVISVGGSSEDDSRFVFDRIISPWLNLSNKQGNIKDFRYENQQIKFITEKIKVNELVELIKKTDFNLEIL